MTLLHHVSGQADTLTQGIDTQIGVIDTSSNRNYGYVATCIYGTCGNGVLVQGQASNNTNWTSVFQALSPAGGSVVNISGTGAETLAQSLTVPTIGLAPDSSGVTPTFSSSTTTSAPVVNSNRASGNDLTVSGSSGKHSRSVRRART